MPNSPTATTAADNNVHVTVRVFHNNHTPESFLRGFTPGQTVTEVAAFTLAPHRKSDLVVADKVFWLFNIGDDPAFGTPDPAAVNYRARGNRSLSVGDVVAVDGRFHSCDPSGWTVLATPPTIDPHAVPGTAPLS